MNATPEMNLEPERYELQESPLYHFDLDRRQFFKLLGSGVVVLFFVEAAIAQESGGGGGGRRGGGGQRPMEVSAWLHIGEDGTVTVFTGKAEMGQNIRTSLTQAVAEELHTPVESIRMVMADTELTPYDAGTFGSRTTPDMGSQLHKVAAAAREALMDLAAEHFKVDRATLVVADGKISKNGTKESVTFGELTKGQKILQSVTAATVVTPAKDWKIAGTSLPKVNGRDFVTGKHKYPSDMKLPGMLFGKVLRPAAFEATLASLDTKLAEAMDGVTVVHDGNFVGVTASDVLQAAHAVDAIKADWTTPTGQPSSQTLFDYLRKNAQNPAPPPSLIGETPDGEHRLAQTYTVAYIAHTPLETRAAVADWKDGKLTVWTGSQRPFGIRSDLASAFGIPEASVRVIVPDTGSGYGGKHTGETAIEAARLAKAAGKPVKVMWTREEEFTWAYFRPAGVIDITSRVKNDGTLTYWDFHNYNSGNSGISSPYDIPDQHSEFHQTRAPLRSGSYRGLAATANHFAREVNMDELAALVKMGPLEFRLKNLKNERLRAVLETATKAFGWSDAKSSSGHGYGLACGTEKGGYLATCVEVLAELGGDSITVVRAVSAFECGAVVNPDHLKNQVEGALVMGLGGALSEAIEFSNGKIENPHLANYRVPRFRDMPKIEVVLMDRKDLPSAGAGESPIMGIAPAISNAIFAATGIRMRSMPMRPDGLKI